MIVRALFCHYRTPTTDATTEHQLLTEKARNYFEFISVVIKTFHKVSSALPEHLLQYFVDTTIITCL
jgi:hypothetical protein